MESEVVYYLYTFEVKVGGVRKKFYFENKKDAELARFVCYKNFDYERITTRNYRVPVSMVERVMLRKPQLDKTPYISNYADFEKVWFGEPEKPEIQTEKGQE
ncbi:MAG: hypothetical protein E7341_05560 [Clostridiales bacterium]|nr:hypothetical protein [Clostridiales bacterium]